MRKYQNPIRVVRLETDLLRNGISCDFFFLFTFAKYDQIPIIYAQKNWTDSLNKAYQESVCWRSS